MDLLRPFDYRTFWHSHIMRSTYGKRAEKDTGEVMMIRVEFHKPSLYLFTRSMRCSNFWGKINVQEKVAFKIKVYCSPPFFRSSERYWILVLLEMEEGEKGHNGYSSLLRCCLSPFLVGNMVPFWKNKQFLWKSVLLNFSFSNNDSMSILQLPWVTIGTMTVWLWHWWWADGCKLRWMTADHSEMVVDDYLGMTGNNSG